MWLRVVCCVALSRKFQQHLSSSKSFMLDFAPKLTFSMERKTVVDENYSVSLYCYLFNEQLMFSFISLFNFAVSQLAPYPLYSALLLTSDILMYYIGNRMSFGMQLVFSFVSLFIFLSKSLSFSTWHFLASQSTPQDDGVTATAYVPENNGLCGDFNSFIDSAAIRDCWDLLWSLSQDLQTTTSVWRRWVPDKEPANIHTCRWFYDVTCLVTVSPEQSSGIDVIIIAIVIISSYCLYYTFIKDTNTNQQTLHNYTFISTTFHTHRTCLL
jgi:hypothetical protein